MTLLLPLLPSPDSVPPTWPVVELLTESLYDGYFTTQQSCHIVTYCKIKTVYGGIQNFDTDAETCEENTTEVLYYLIYSPVTLDSTWLT